MTFQDVAQPSPEAFYTKVLVHKNMAQGTASWCDDII